MKKVFAILVLTAFVACNGEATVTETADSVVIDSVAIEVDTAAVTANDSTVAEIEVNGEASPKGSIK